jgi:hypothetical protein
LLPSPTCPWTPNKNDIDEVVYITDDPRITGTLATKFETYWTDTSRQLQGLRERVAAVSAVLSGRHARTSR